MSGVRCRWGAAMRPRRAPLRMEAREGGGGREEGGVRRPRTRRGMLGCACASCLAWRAPRGAWAEAPPGAAAGAGALAERYNPRMAEAMDTGMAAYEAAMEGRKRALLGGDARGVVAELGIGTGPNLRFYDARRVTRVVGIEPNAAMDPYAEERARRAGIPLDVVRGVAEALPLEDHSVDTVVSTLVLCSVTDQAASLREVARVLRPGGTFLFVEHVAAPSGTWLRLAQNALNPLQMAVSDGCHLNRDTALAIEEAAPELFPAGVDLQRFDVDTLAIIAPHIMGAARVAA